MGRGLLRHRARSRRHFRQPVRELARLRHSARRASRNLKAFSARLQNLGYEQIKDECGIRGRGYRGIKVHMHYCEEEKEETDHHG